jgi:hypothetical protein
MLAESAGFCKGFRSAQKWADRNRRVLQNQARKIRRLAQKSIGYRYTTSKKAADIGPIRRIVLCNKTLSFCSSISSPKNGEFRLRAQWRNYRQIGTFAVDDPLCRAKRLHRWYVSANATAPGSGII